MMRALRFVYKNYKDEIEERTIMPEKGGMEWFSHGRNDFHPDGGWMISGLCLTRNARRTFELRRIIGPIVEIEVGER